MIDQTGFTENYTYNALGHSVASPTPVSSSIVSYSYDPAGRWPERSTATALTPSILTNAAGELLALVNFAPNGSINSSFSYTYDALGRETSMVTSGGTTNYGYDADGQLTSVALPTDEVIAYPYDAMGNRAVVIDNGAIPSTRPTTRMNTPP